MNRTFLKNKKGVSILVAYVLLIVIVIGLGVGVYSWLKTQIPNPEEECPWGISLIISDVVCGGVSTIDEVNDDEIKILFKNKGTFDIDGAYIRIGNELSNDNPVFEIEPVVQDTETVPGKPGFFYFGIGGLKAATDEMNVKFNFKNVYRGGDSSSFQNVKGVNVIQVQPFIVSSETNEIVLCEEASFTKSASCS